MTQEDQITIIINRLDELSLEVHKLTQELRSLQHGQHIQPFATTNNAVPAREPNLFEHPYKDGDKVIITNAYLGRKGTHGTVINTTAKRITLVDQQGKKHTRKPDNIKYE